MHQLSTKIPKTLITTTSLILISGVTALARVHEAATQRSNLTSQNSRLRSAAGLRSKPDFSDAGTADEIRDRLQAHFDEVISTLMRNNRSSLDIGLDRLQQSERRRWSAAERKTRWQQLLISRMQNIASLVEYRDRGVFPINESTRFAIPIFIDRHDTACAVGHLMRVSGWRTEAAFIAEQDNNVYVPDVESGPLVQWVLLSGLTQEEAALIQPGYQPPAPDVALADLLQPNASLSRHGLRFENFELSVSSAIPSIGVSGQQGVFMSPDGASFVPALSHWLFVGADDVGGIFTGPGSFVGLLGFDVVAEDARTRIDQAGLTSNPNFNFNFADDGEMAMNAVFRADDDSLLGSVELTNGDEPFFFFGQQAVEFAPQERIRVLSGWDMSGQVSFTSLTYDFNAIPIPEPSTRTIAALALFAFVLLQRAICLGRRGRKLS